jgi:hypothetical protein
VTVPTGHDYRLGRAARADGQKARQVPAGPQGGKGRSLPWCASAHREGLGGAVCSLMPPQAEAGERNQ